MYQNLKMFFFFFLIIKPYKEFFFFNRFEKIYMDEKLKILNNLCMKFFFFFKDKK